MTAPHEPGGDEFGRLKRILSSGGVALGYFLTIPSVSIARAIAVSGADFVIIDMEHAPIDKQELHATILATAGTGCVPVVRVPEISEPAFKAALDLGSAGLLIPGVTSPAQLSDAYRLAHYPPQGSRGFGPAAALDRWKLSVDEYVEDAQDVLLVGIVESEAGWVSIEEIVASPRVAVVFIGERDLATSLGHVANPGDRQVRQAVAEIEAATRRAGVALGGMARTDEEVQALRERGYQMICLGTELGELSASVRRRLAAARR